MGINRNNITGKPSVGSAEAEMTDGFLRLNGLKLNITEVLRDMGNMEIFIKGINDRHIFFFDIEIKNISVAPDTFRVYGFRNYGNSLLDCPAQTDLCRRSGIFGSEDAHNIIIKISTSCQRGIGLYLYAISSAVFDKLRRIT